MTGARRLMDEQLLFFAQTETHWHHCKHLACVPMRFVVVACICSAIWASLRDVIPVLMHRSGVLVRVSRPAKFSVWEQRTINHPKPQSPRCGNSTRVQPTARKV